MLVIFTRKNRLIAAAFGIACVCAVLSGAAAPGRDTSAAASIAVASSSSLSLSLSAANGVSTTPSPFIPLPATQQGVDTHLSLSPSSTSPSTIRHTTSLVTGCTLSLSFTQSNSDPQVAGTLSYSLTAKNLGGTTCQSTSVSIYYADNETFVSAMPAATAGGYYWVIGNLGPGKEADISVNTYRTASPATSVLTSEACLSATNGSDACTDALRTSLTSAAQTVPATEPAAPVLVTTLAPHGKELGIWIWTPVDTMSQADMQQTINEVTTNNFNVIYLTIDASLDAESANNLNAFLTLAAQKNIAVDAEAGARSWGDTNHLSEASQVISFVQAYNQTHLAKFRGVQFDIEPYLLPNYAGNEPQILTQYLNLVDQAATQAANANIPLTIVVPHFYDDVVQWAPQVTVDGVTNYPYNQILRILNRSTGNRIIVMAYRNFSAGDDGSIALSETEVDEADSTNVKVIVAQETGPVTPSYVTFNGTSRADLATQAAAISAAYAPDNSFGGIAIDYLNPFLMLP